MLVELTPGPCRRQADRRWWWLPIGPQWLPVELLPVDQPWLLGWAEPVAVACSPLGPRWPDCSVRFGCWRTQKTETRGKVLSETVMYHNAGGWRRQGQAGEQVETRARVERSRGFQERCSRRGLWSWFPSRETLQVRQAEKLSKSESTLRI